MGKRFKQFGLEARCEMARRREAGESLRQIAAALDCSASSVSRELRRNASRQKGYQPVYADEQASARRWHGSRLLRDADLQADVLAGLKQGWSPEQVSARLERQISYESIYRFIEAQIARTKDYTWRHYLPRGKSQRGWRGRRGGSPVDHIQQRLSIEKRPAQAAARQQPGHWEADLMLFSRYGQARADVARAHDASDRRGGPRQQSRSTRGRNHAIAAGTAAACTATHAHLRQRHRVCPAPHSASAARYPNFFLRSALTLAERGYRKCQWPLATIPAAQNRLEHTHTTAHPPSCPSLQSHPSKMPRLQNTSRSLRQCVAFQL